MSRFRVKINQTTNNMDITSIARGYSMQKSVHLLDESGASVIFKDGQEFNGSNWWKKYCFPQTDIENASLVLLYDDGSVWNGEKSVSKIPVIKNKTIKSGSILESENKIDIQLECHGGVAQTTQITNRCTFPNKILKVRFNESDNAIMELYSGDTQSFGKDDFLISKLDFINEEDVDIPVQILVTIVPV